MAVHGLSVRGKRRRLAALALAALLAFSGAAGAADLAGSSQTIPYLYSESLADKSKSYLALYEFMDFGANNLGVERLDFYFSGWGRGDALTKMDPENKALGDAQLGSAYVRWHDENSVIDVSLGRRLVTIGPVLDQVDGVTAQIGPFAGFGLQMFGGAPVFSQYSDRTGDWGYGGRLFGGYQPYFEIGVSSVAFTEMNDLDRAIIGGDFRVLPSQYFDLLGHAYYDFLYGSLYDASGTLVVRPTADLKIHGQVEREMPAAYLGMNSWFSVFSFDTITKSQGEICYTIARRVVLHAEYDNYLYDSSTSGNRYGGSAGVLWGEKRDNTFNLGAFRLDRADNGYWEARAFFNQDIVGKAYVALDGMYYKLDKELYKTAEGFDGTGTVGWHILEKSLDLQASGIYTSSPYYKSDVRGLMKLAYNWGSHSPYTTLGNY